MIPGCQEKHGIIRDEGTGPKRYIHGGEKNWMKKQEAAKMDLQIIKGSSLLLTHFALTSIIQLSQWQT